jgi:hypothetical protein
MHRAMELHANVSMDLEPVWMNYVNHVTQTVALVLLVIQITIAIVQRVLVEEMYGI